MGLVLSQVNIWLEWKVNIWLVILWQLIVMLDIFFYRCLPCTAVAQLLRIWFEPETTFRWTNISVSFALTSVRSMVSTPFFIRFRWSREHYVKDPTTRRLANIRLPSQAFIVYWRILMHRCCEQFQNTTLHFALITAPVRSSKSFSREK